MACGRLAALHVTREWKRRGCGCADSAVHRSHCALRVAVAGAKKCVSPRSCVPSWPPCTTPTPAQSPTLGSAQLADDVRGDGLAMGLETFTTDHWYTFGLCDSAAHTHTATRDADVDIIARATTAAHSRGRHGGVGTPQGTATPATTSASWLIAARASRAWVAGCAGAEESTRVDTHPATARGRRRDGRRGCCRRRCSTHRV